MSTGSNKPSATDHDPSRSVVTPVVRKKLQQFYEHGTRLMQQEKYDFGYAHSILVECVVHDPGNLLYVEAFLQNLQKKFNNNKRGALLAFGGKGPFKQAFARKDWGEVLKLGPEILKSNPWAVTTLRAMASACAELGFHEVGLRYLKNALAPRPMDPEVNKHCAQSLARIGQFDQAIACWQRVDEANRGDLEAQKMISELQIAKTMGHGGLASGEAVRRQAAAKAARVAEEKEQSQAVSSAGPVRREIKLTRRQELEQELANRPADIEAYLELARLHVEEERLAEAAHVLNKALAASGNSHKVQERIEDVEILRKKQQLAIAEKRAESRAEKRAESTPDDEPQKLVAQIRDDLNCMELEMFQRRSQRYPNDLELRFQLGLRLKRAGNFREALNCFEASQALPDRQAGSLLERGECLQRQKQYDKALECYRLAARETAPERMDLKKMALYRWGLLAEGLKDWDSAEHGFAELNALDSGYKDAATRLDKIRAMRHNHA